MNIEEPDAMGVGEGLHPEVGGDGTAPPDSRIPRREIPEGTDPYTSLISVCWRAMRQGAQERDQRRRFTETEEQRRHAGLAAVAQEWYRVGRMVEDPRWSDGGVWMTEVRRGLESSISRWNEVAADLGITVVAPVGAEYAGDLVNYLGNAAQIPTPGLERALVREVIVPAILVDGKLQRAGDAVIAIPGAETGGGAKAAGEASQMSAVSAILARKREI